MSKKELIKQLKRKNPQLKKFELENVINIFYECIITSLKNRNNAEIRGFGSWYCKILKENFNARNPATNELIYKPERVKVRFKPSKKLKKIINDE